VVKLLKFIPQRIAAVMLTLNWVTFSFSHDRRFLMITESKAEFFENTSAN
jgi:hypothetical protein